MRDARSINASAGQLVRLWGGSLLRAMPKSTACGRAGGANSIHLALKGATAFRSPWRKAAPNAVQGSQNAP
jgi:hypothetical protein